MATEFPIPEDFGRFIPPMSAEEESGEIGEIPLSQLFSADAQEEIEEMEDGSAIVRMSDLKTPDESPDFYTNMAEDLDSWELSKIAIKYIDLIEKDKQAREDRDKQYEEGLRRTGLGHDAPGGASFMGASRVVHPIMAETCIDFSARAIKELFPPDGPVKTKITGEVTDQKVTRAERKRDFMNWQITEQIEEYRDEQEQTLTQTPLGGSQYMKIWRDDQKKRSCVEFLPIDNVYLPYAAGNFYTASRVTEVNDITQEEFEVRVDSGLYIDIDIFRASQDPEQTKPEKANDKIEGKSSSDNIDGVRRVFHVYTWMELEEDNFSKGDRAPYILMIDELTTEVVGLYRNWEDGDKTMAKMDWIVEFKFIPWRGAYAIGLPHLIGGISAALTGSLRALLDSAHINTNPTMLKLKGGKMSGQSIVVEPTQVTEIEAAPGIDDIRKVAMPMPFNQPSPVLFQLLGWLTNAAKGVVTTAEEKIADVTSNSPVGTTQALIEQGAAVFSSIHARLHTSQARVFKILARLNRWYLDEDDIEMARELGVTSEDFEKNDDIIPVSDPHIFAETQRYAQVQALAARAQANPDLYNRLAVEKRILKQIKIPDINEVLPDPAEVKQMNPALENVAMSLGKPVGAFPGQDHLAHIQVHLDYAKDPMYGSNPIIAPAYIPAMLEHLKQHLTLAYLDSMDSYTSQALGRPFNILKEQPVLREAQQLLAASSQHFALDSQQMFSGVTPIVQQMMGMMQQLRQMQQPTDPSVQALVQTQMAETQRKGAYDQARLQLDGAKLVADTAAKQEKNVADQQIKAAEITQDIGLLTLEQKHELQKQQLQAQQQMEMAAQQEMAAMQQQEQQQMAAMQQPQPQVPPQGA
jgi:chaperonin GroES